MTIDIPIRLQRVIESIQELYEVHPTGGYGHLVFDDGNYHCVKSCATDARNSVYRKFYDTEEEHEEVRKASIKALELCFVLLEDEIEFCVIMYRALRDELVLQNIS